MADNTLAGKWVGIKMYGKYINCQLDATVTYNNTFEEESPCKPLDEDEETDLFIKRTLSTQDTTVTVNHRSFLEQLGANVTILDILGNLGNGNVEATAEILTSVGKHNQPNDILLEVPVVIESYAWNIPQAGRANGDLTLQGNGKPLLTVIPVGS